MHHPLSSTSHSSVSLAPGLGHCSVRPIFFHPTRSRDRCSVRRTRLHSNPNQELGGILCSLTHFLGSPNFEKVGNCTYFRTHMFSVSSNLPNLSQFFGPNSTDVCQFFWIGHSARNSDQDKGLNSFPDRSQRQGQSMCANTYRTHKC